MVMVESETTLVLSGSSAKMVFLAQIAEKVH